MRLKRTSSELLVRFRWGTDGPMLPPAPATWSFSTDGLPPRDRAAALHALRERGILPLEPLPGCVPQADITKRILPGVGILSGTLGGLRQIGAANDREIGEDVLLGVNLAGVSTARQRGQEVTLRRGEAILVSCTEGGLAMHRPTLSHFLGVRLPHKSLAPLAANLDDATMRMIPAGNGSLRLLTNYVGCLGPAQISDSAELGHAIAAHILDLIALSIGAGRDTIAAAQERGVRAARLRAIKADVARHLADCRLTVTAVATRHGVTPRYIHKLFAGEGVSFSEFVLDRRLAAVHRWLTDRRLEGRSIAGLAFDAGFGDLSYFNRTFRRRFNATPTEVRYRESR
jgi:AraC-like DNA-binding protein